MYSNWKWFNIYRRAIEIFFTLNVVFSVLNKIKKKPLISPEIIGYLFWLSLGLYLGFNLCRIAYSKALKNK